MARPTSGLVWIEPPNGHLPCAKLVMKSFFLLGDTGRGHALDACQKASHFQKLIELDDHRNHGWPYFIAAAGSGS